VTSKGVEKGAKDPPRVVFIKIFWKSIDDWVLLLNAFLLFIIATAGGKYGIRGICISFHEDSNKNRGFERYMLDAETELTDLCFRQNNPYPGLNRKTNPTFGLKNNPR
jgi:hypothetical protein